MMQAVEVHACIPHGFSIKRNHADRHCLMPVLWNPSVSGFRCCKVYNKICKKPCSKLTEFCQYSFNYQGNSVNEHALKKSLSEKRTGNQPETGRSFLRFPELPWFCFMTGWRKRTVSEVLKRIDMTVKNICQTGFQGFCSL